MPLKLHPAQTPGLIEMGVRSLEAFAALAQKPPPAGPPNPPPVGIHGVASGARASPATPAAVRFRHIAAEPQLGQRDHRLVTVIPLVRDHLGEASVLRQDRFDVLRRRDQRLDHRRRVARASVQRQKFLCSRECPSDIATRAVHTQKHGRSAIVALGDCCE